VYVRRYAALGASCHNIADCQCWQWISDVER